MIACLMVERSPGVCVRAGAAAMSKNAPAASAIEILAVFRIIRSPPLSPNSDN
jgi:hypothetical protein